MSDTYSTVFVFQESIEKTNIQRGELIALIELAKENVVTEILDNETIFQNNNTKDGFITYQTELVIPQDEYLKARIVFYSQCAVVFSNFELDIKEILRRSGYIQSAGKFIFMAKWEMIESHKILEILLSYCISDQKARKIVFYKSSDNEVIDFKLNNLLIDDSRYHIGTESFHKAELSISNKFENQLISKGITKEGKEPVFFIKDTGVVNENSPLNNLYFDRNVVEYSISYISEFKKDNSVHYLDDHKECKPFWAGIYTTPHRLMNAMLNLARVTKDSIIVDPFSHTGTLAVEASQIGCKVKAFDLHEIQGAKDNYEFLCSGGDKIIQTCTKILEKIVDNKLSEELQNVLQDSICLNKQGLPEVKEGRRIEDLLHLNPLFSDYENRLYFYLLRRYEMEKLRGAKLEDSSAINFASRHVKSVMKDKTITNIKDNFYPYFGGQLKAFETANKNNKFPVIYLAEDSNNEQGCHFTDSIYKTNRVGYLNYSLEDPDFDLKDILKDEYKIEESSIDAIVTDPPYGYGEGLDKNEVKEIYNALFEKSFKWLKQLGILVFCTLDKVKTGRREGLLFTEDIIEIANFVARKNNVFFNLNYFYPTQVHKKCLYYWKSKYALNRSIIVLRINK